MSEVQPIKDKRDIERMKQALSGRDLLLFIVGINTSLRISDILELKREDFTGTHIRVVELKTNKTKVIRINDALATAVNNLADDDGYLFKSRKGVDKPISRIQAYRVLNTAAKRVGLPINFGTHTLRKTFAYHAYNNGKGCDLALLMRVLNHSSQRETLRYIGIDQQRQDDVYLAVNL